MARSCRRCKRVISAGAPVPADVVARMRELLPEDAQFWTPYGATECLPVAVIEGRELQATREAHRARRRHLRRPPGAAERGAHHRASTTTRSPTGTTRCSCSRAQVGEITVAGPTATDAYFRRDAATRSRRSARPRPTAASASCIAWATSAGSTAKGGCGSAAASRIACVTDARRRCTPNRSSRSSTRIPTCAAPRWSASARAARRRRCCASRLRPGIGRATQHDASPSELRAHRRRPRRTPRKIATSCCIPASRSTSATTPRSAARTACGRRAWRARRAKTGRRRA